MRRIGTAAAALGLVLGCAPGQSIRGDTVAPAVARPVFHSPSSLEAYLRAEIAFDRGDFDLAVQEFNEALAASDEDPFVLSRLVIALRRAGKDEQAALRLERGRLNHPGSLELQELADGTNPATRAHARPTEFEPSFGDEALRTFLERRDWSKLRTALLAVSPADPDAALLRVRAWSKLGEYELAYGQALFANQATEETYCAAVLSLHFEDALNWAPSDDAKNILTQLLVGTHAQAAAATLAARCLR